MADDTKLDDIINNPLFHQDRVWAKQQMKLLFLEVAKEVPNTPSWYENLEKIVEAL